MATLTSSFSSTTSSSSPSCTTAVPDKYGYVPPDSCNANYGFYPQWEDNTAFAVCFGLTTVAHVVQAVVMKKVTRSSQVKDYSYMKLTCVVLLLGHRHGCLVGMSLLHPPRFGGQRPAGDGLRGWIYSPLPPRTAL